MKKSDLAIKSNNKGEAVNVEALLEAGLPAPSASSTAAAAGGGKEGKPNVARARGGKKKVEDEGSEQILHKESAAAHESELIESVMELAQNSSSDTQTDVKAGYADKPVDTLAGEKAAATEGINGMEADGPSPWVYALGALGAVALAAAGGGGGGGGGGGASTNVVTGLITAGPLVSGHGLSVELFKADGVTSLGVATVSASGRYSIDVGTYTGVVIAKVSDGTALGADYKDEASGRDVNLTATLMAVGVITGSSLVLNINPLTAIAAQKAGLAAGGSGSVADAATASNANAAVASAFGLSDITTTDPDLTNDGTAATNAIGAVLAALSGQDAITGNAQTTINNFVADITQTAAVGVLSQSGQSALLLGGAAADPDGTLGLVNALSDAMSAAVTTTGFTIGDVATDNIIKPTDALSTSTTITGTVPTGTAQSDLGIKFGAVAGTGAFALTGTTWTYTLSAADVTALTNAAEGALAVELTVATLTKGRRMVLVNMVDDQPTAVTFLNPVTSIFENAVNTSGTKVADINIADVDGYNGGVPTVGGADAANFEVKTVSGKYELWFKNTVAFDKETKASYAVTVTAGTTASTTLNVAIANVNEAPTGTSSTIAITEDLVNGRALTAADFGFADASDNPANALAAVIITTPPTAGTLKLNGVAVTPGQSIAVADLPNLVFAPALNANGNGYATIGFKVQDNGGTANGGVDTSASANTLTINVTPLNDAPMLATPTPIALTDTAAKDTFTNQTGTLAGSDVDGDTLTYGISSGTTGGSTVINTVTYDVSKVGTYGTLYVKSSDGSYVYVPNATAINALTANATDTFTVQSYDGSLLGSATLTVNVTGADDAPVLVSGFITDGTPSTGDDDYIQLVIGQALSGATLAADFVDPDIGDGPLVFSVISGSVPGITFHADGTVTGTPSDAGGSYPRDYTLKIRATDANNSALYVEHDYVVHMLKAPVIQSFTVADTATTNGASLGKSGETLDVALLFSEVVNVTGSPTITLSINGQSVTATYASGTGAVDKTLHFTATVPAGSSADGTNISISSVTANTASNKIIGQDSGQPWDTTPMPPPFTGYRVDNTAPTITPSYSVAENTSADTALKTVTLAANETVTWSGLAGADMASFTLGTGADVGKLLFAGVSNFETKTSYSVSVIGTDNAGNATTQAVTVNVTNVNEAPVVTATAIADVVAVTGTAYTLGSPLYLDGVSANISSYFTDPDTTTAFNTLTYSLAAGAPSWLQIDPTTGKLYGTAPATAAADLAVTVHANDGVNTVSKDFRIDVVAAPALSTTLDDDPTKLLDVTSNIVLSVDQTVTAQAGKYITINNTGGTGYRGEATDTGTHDFQIEATDSRVSIGGGKIVIDPNLLFDLDLANDYTVTVDAGAFLNTLTGQANGAFSFDFHTVGVGTTVANAVQSYKMNTSTGAMDLSNKWLDAEGNGSGLGSAIFDFNLSGGNYTVVMKDVWSAGGDVGLAGIETQTDFNVRLLDFNSGDRFYIDDAFNDATKVNDITQEAFPGGNGVQADLFLGLNGGGGGPELRIRFEAPLAPAADSLLANVDIALGLSGVGYQSAVIVG